MKYFVFSTKSASSPPYPSPDSILPDSGVNSKCLSDSPAVSPSVICADLTSSTPCNSSVFVLPPKISPQSISKTSKYIDVNFASQNSSQSAPALSKKFPLSIAERRGSLSKCLKLPMLTDDFERKGGHLKSVANEQDILGVDNPSDKEATVFGVFHESWEKKPCNESSSAVLNGVVDTSGACCNLVKPVVYRWPSLEILATCSIDDLDSKGAYIFIIPTSGLGKDASRAVYVWVGRSFSCHFSKVWQVDCKGPGDPGEIDWNQAASDVLHQMVLPIDSNIKEVTDASLGNSPLQKCKLRLRTIDPCGRTLPWTCAYWELSAPSFPFYISPGSFNSQQRQTAGDFFPSVLALVDSDTWYLLLAGGSRYSVELVEVKLDCTIQIERFAMLLEFLVETACYMRGKAEDANEAAVRVVRGGSPECTCYSAATPDDRLRGNSLTRLFVVHLP
ncbi:hypothetical protein BC332_14230 [Capsicum chinense]|nr:hypothetical protein BC332_14230 [Capsicum chinense]